jgi:hypothetical protein
MGSGTLIRQLMDVGLDVRGTFQLWAPAPNQFWGLCSFLPCTKPSTAAHLSPSSARAGAIPQPSCSVLAADGAGARLPLNISRHN